MAKRIVLGFLIIAFGLLYNQFRTDSEQPKEVKKELVFYRSAEDSVIWIDNKFYDVMQEDEYILKNAPLGNYELGKIYSEIEKTQLIDLQENKTTIIIKKSIISSKINKNVKYL